MRAKDGGSNATYQHHEILRTDLKNMINDNNDKLAVQ